MITSHTDIRLNTYLTELDNPKESMLDRELISCLLAKADPSYLDGKKLLEDLKLANFLAQWTPEPKERKNMFLLVCNTYQNREDLVGFICTRLVKLLHY